MLSKDAPLSFWSQAFAGGTPPSALALALEHGLVPADLVASHKGTWLSSWLKGQYDRMTDAYDLEHRPWRQFGGAGRQARDQMELPPRLTETTADLRSVGMADLFLALGEAGLGWNDPLPSPVEWGPTPHSAAMAKNLPVVFDALAKLPSRPQASELDAELTPIPVLGERYRLPWLHAAARAWQDSLLEALLDYGLNPNQVDAKGQTALFHARTHRAVKALLAAGANPSVLDKDGRNAIQACWSLTPPILLPVPSGQQDLIE